VLLAEEGDHERGNAIDPTGVWLNRANPNPPVILIAFHRDGTYLADVQGESAFVPNNHDPGFQITSPTHALWQKTGAKTLAGTSFALQYNDDGSFYGLLKVRVTGVLIDSDHMDLTVSGGVFDLNGNPILNPPLPRWYWALRTPTAGVPVVVTMGAIPPFNAIKGNTLCPKYLIDREIPDVRSLTNSNGGRV